MAWKFIKTMTSVNANVLNAKIAGELPARRAAYKDQWFQESALGKEMTGWSQYIQDIWPYSAVSGRLSVPPPDLVEAAQRIILGKEPIKKVLNEAAKKYDQKIGA